MSPEAKIMLDKQIQIEKNKIINKPHNLNEKERSNEQINIKNIVDKDRIAKAMFKLGKYDSVYKPMNLKEKENKNLIRNDDSNYQRSALTPLLQRVESIKNKEKYQLNIPFLPPINSKNL